MPYPMRRAAGGVVIRDDGFVLIREPSNHYDGYVWTFPKGGVDDGESDEEGALREVLEETGIQASIVAPIPGEWLGGTTVNRYFLMRFIARVADTDNETQTIGFVDYATAKVMISQTTNPKGKKRDLEVLDAAFAVWSQHHAAPPPTRRHTFANPSPLPNRAPLDAAFSRWFSGSKVVDAQGRPLVVYHGTPRSGFDVFRAPARRGIFFSDVPDVAWTYTHADTDTPVTRTSANLRRGKPALYEVFLRVTKPLVVDAMGRDWANVPVYGIPEAQRDAVVNAVYPYASALSTDDLVAAAKTLGYDGVIVKNVVDIGDFTDYEGTSTIYAVFDPRQVKSANMNAGTFDPADPNMRRNPRHRFA